MRSNRQKYGMFFVASILTILSLPGFVHGQTPGTEKWRFVTGGIGPSSPAIGADGTIYVGADNNRLYAINPDGTEKWHFRTGSYVNSSPAIGADGTIYVGTADNNLYAINPSGAYKWRFATGSIVVSSPAIGANGTIYVGSDDNNLYAINPDGTEKWRFVTGGYVSSSPAIGVNGTIYVGSYDGSLYAICPDGTEKWRFVTEGYVHSSPAIGVNGTIYVGSDDGSLYAINPDGTKKWRFIPGLTISPVHSSPAIGADGTIYVGSSVPPPPFPYGAGLHARNPDGTHKWYFETRWNVVSSPAIGADGTIYVGCADGNLYAIYSTSPGLAHTPWPMFHHDLKHTGWVLAQAPLPDIKANGSDGPLTILYGSNLTVNVQLAPGSYDGEDADWWVMAKTPFGRHWYTLDNGWVRSYPPIRVYAGSLFDLSPFEVLNISGLPMGSYTFYFGVDMLMNNLLDLTEFYYDSVGVTIERE